MPDKLEQALLERSFKDATRPATPDEQDFADTQNTLYKLAPNSKMAHDNAALLELTGPIGKIMSYIGGLGRGGNVDAVTFPIPYLGGLIGYRSNTPTGSTMAHEYQHAADARNHPEMLNNAKKMEERAYATGDRLWDTERAFDSIMPPTGPDFYPNVPTSPDPLETFDIYNKEKNARQKPRTSPAKPPRN